MAKKSVFESEKEKEDFAKLGKVLTWIDDFDITIDLVITWFFSVEDSYESAFGDLILSRLRVYDKIEILKELLKDKKAQQALDLDEKDIQTMVELNKYRNKLVHSGYYSDEGDENALFINRKGTIKPPTDAEMTDWKQKKDMISNKITKFILKEGKKEKEEKT